MKTAQLLDTNSGLIIKYSPLFVAIIILSAAIAPAAAAPTIDYDLIEPETLYIGIPLNIDVLIRSHLDSNIHHPVKDTIGVFAILNIDKQTYTHEHEDFTIADNQKVTRFSYRLAGFDTGQQRIPALNFEVHDNDGQQHVVLSTSPFTVTIGSVLPDTIDTIKDISPPLRLNLGFWDIFIPLAIILLIVLMVYLMVKKMKKPLVEEVPEIEKDTRPDYVKALELLENLKKKKLLEKGEYIEFYYQLSLILRIFIEMHYEFKAVEMTTGEIDRYVKNHYTADSDSRVSYSSREQFTDHKQIFDILRYSDLVKFAKLSPNLEKSRQSLEWLENYFKSFANKTSPDKGEKNNQ